MQGAEITPIPILPLGMINAFLVRGAGGCVLVDAGLKGSEARVGKVLARLGLAFRDVDAIVITHAHGDHAGGAHRLRELCHAPVIAHEADLPYYRQERRMRYCPTGAVGRLMLKAGVDRRGYEAFTPDEVLRGDEAFDLGGFGVQGMAFCTPGHTQGSISVTLADRRVLAGDLLASGLLLGGIALRGRPKAPPFEEDGARVAQELRGLLGRGMETFYLGHGGPLSARAVQRYVARISRNGGG